MQKNKHFNQNKIDIKLAYYEKRTTEYLDEIDELDNEEIVNVEKKLSKYKELIESELKEEKKVYIIHNI